MTSLWPAVGAHLVFFKNLYCNNYHFYHCIVIPVCDQGVDSYEESYPHRVCSQSEDGQS